MIGQSTSEREVELNVLIRQVSAALLEKGVPPSEVVSAFLGAAIDLSSRALGPERTKSLVSDVALMLDEELHSPEK